MSKQPEISRVFEHIAASVSTFLPITIESVSMQPTIVPGHLGPDPSHSFKYEDFPLSNLKLCGSPMVAAAANCLLQTNVIGKAQPPRMVLVRSDFY